MADPASPTRTDEPPPASALPWPLADVGDAAALREGLVAAYSGADRDYHDLQHLREVLQRLEELAAHGTAFASTPVLLAAWFHDSVYDGERDAEERSAAWAEEALAPLVEESVTAEVARLVRMTETHRPADDDQSGCALSDADLAILAAPSARYEEYVAAIRREYSHVDEDDFALGRAAVLRELLDKPRLFHTAYAAEHWEERARANVAAELEHLEPRVEALLG